MLKRLILPAGGALALLFSGCATLPRIMTPPPKPAPPVPIVGTASIKGSEETSMLLDNFTAFVVAVNGLPVAAGRAGWNTAVDISAGNNTLTVEFDRGNFTARADLELSAAAGASYEVKFATDAQVFGHNSYCNFWIVDLATSQTVTPVKRASVSKRK